MLRTLACGIVATIAGTTLAAACDSETPCEIENGSYLIEMPAPDVPIKGALVFLHGAGSSGKSSMNNSALVSAVTARGYVFAAANGSSRPGRNGLSWSFYPGFPKLRDETAFFGALFDDLAANHGVDRDHIIMGGFSAGGFMTSYLACDEPDIASAFTPVSGGFWRPAPESCAGPVRLFHTHGWTDTTVPLEGRYLRSGSVAQGDIFHGMEIWRDANSCDALRADQFEITDGFWRRSWDRCTPGSALEFALFPGGHRVPAGWADMMLDWYEDLPDIDTTEAALSQ